MHCRSSEHCVSRRQWLGSVGAMGLAGLATPAVAEQLKKDRKQVLFQREHSARLPVLAADGDLADGDVGEERLFDRDARVHLHRHLLAELRGRVAALQVAQHGQPGHGAAVVRILQRPTAQLFAAERPVLLIALEDVTPADFAREKEIFLAQAIASGKPANIAEKMVSGKMEKFYEEVCLLEQPFIKDQTISIGQLIASKIGKLGENIAVRRFARFKVGDAGETIAVTKPTEPKAE